MEFTFEGGYPTPITEIEEYFESIPNGHFVRTSTIAKQFNIKETKLLRIAKLYRNINSIKINNIIYFGNKKTVKEYLSKRKV